MKVSNLPKTWILDLDGTLVKHNGYLIDGVDTLLDGVEDFFKGLSKDDMVIILTARKNEYKEMTLKFLKENDIRFDYIFFDMPVGERILINDKKPKGLKTSVAINTERDVFLKETFEIDDDI